MTVTGADRSTITRQREFHDLMEKFIETRRRAFIPRARELAAAIGLPEASVPFFGHLKQVAKEDVIPAERLRRRVCYASKERWRERLAELVAAGLAEPVDDSWRLTPRGVTALQSFWDAVHEQLRALPLPADGLRRTVTALRSVVESASGGEYDRLTSVRRTRTRGWESADDAVRIEQLMFETCVLLDDGHIHAWQRAGYRGPVLDVLTKVWYGATTREDLYKALAYSQEPAHVDAHIDELVARGDVAVEGRSVTLTPQGRATRDRIEAETDRDGLARWPQGAALETLMADVAALVSVLPAEEDLPKGPTH
jgi:hypothetical protein